jgi:hypothetical protein
MRLRNIKGVVNTGLKELKRSRSRGSNFNSQEKLKLSSSIQKRPSMPAQTHESKKFLRNVIALP